ncbi:MAG: phytoene desaturase family protein [Dehalococcoidia bacterium]
MQQADYDAVIIGGGHNGLVTAGYLAKEGLSALVLERQDIVGGACVTEQLYPGFNVPYCAYICYMLHGKVIEDLELKNHGLDIIPTTGGRFHPYPDGKYMYIGGDYQRNIDEIAKFSEHDARAYSKWASFWQRAAGILYRYWLQEPPTLEQVAEDLRSTVDEEVWEALLTAKMKDLLGRYFESEYVKAFFLDPEHDPSEPGCVLSSAYHQCVRFSKPENVGLPRGGMGKITEAMATFARARGAEIRTGTWVERIIVEGGVARGVVVHTGEEIRASTVVSNADPKTTYLKLVERSELGEAFIRRVENLTTKGGSVKFLAALKELPDFRRYLGKDFGPRLIASTEICPSVEYYEKSWEAAFNGKLSLHPVMSIQIPSIYDPSLAPPGHHVMSVWCRYAPVRLKQGSWETEGPKVGEHIIDILTEYAPNFRDSLIDWTVQTPTDIETREGATDGNHRHIDITARQIFAGRMPYRSPIEGLYLCGAGTHPGGEVTGVPGHNAARAILNDLATEAGIMKGAG